MDNILIRNAKVLDGGGGEAYDADLRIANNKIIQIGPELPAGGEHVLDASGLVACPGFIDMHSHADLAYLKRPTPDQKIRQGVTSEVLGQDGLGVAPVNPASLPDLQEIIGGLQGRLSPDGWTWRSFADYLETLGKVGVPTNVAALATHAPLRLIAMGMQKRFATGQELAHMQRLLEECLESGAFGLSTGLEYPPQYYANQDELIALNKITARYDGVYLVHQRNEARDIQSSFQEQLSIAQGSGVRLHISHLKTWGQANWGRIDAILSMADEFHASGGAITWDRYPYLAGSTLLGIILPEWAWADGTQVLIHNLKEAGYRERLQAEFGKDPQEWENDPSTVGWENILVSGVTLEKNHWMQGRSVADLAAQTGMDEVSLVCDLLAEERLAVTAIFFYGSEDVLEKVLAHPLACVGSDGVHLGMPHPRLYGSFPHFIEQFALRKKIISLPEAVRKVTSLPAEILGLQKRGR
ncbi:MAG: amidohydrolase family protein, partial [Anaerolineaceae bacterium]|nr:amidohydrolase family protein [Anaerolineaceae bacterium]